MAICEVCGNEVAPGDAVVYLQRDEKHEHADSEHYFCSEEHKQQYHVSVSEQEASEAGRTLALHGAQTAEDEPAAPGPSTPRKRRSPNKGRSPHS